MLNYIQSFSMYLSTLLVFFQEVERNIYLLFTYKDTRFETFIELTHRIKLMIMFVANKIDKNVNQIISIASKRRIDSEGVGKLSALADLVQQCI